MSDLPWYMGRKAVLAVNVGWPLCLAVLFAFNIREWARTHNVSWAVLAGMLLACLVLDVTRTVARWRNR